MAIRRKTSAAGTAKETSTVGTYVPLHELIRERIAEDMVAFEDAGGQVEVLGNTPLRHVTKTARSTAVRGVAKTGHAPAGGDPAGQDPGKA